MVVIKFSLWLLGMLNFKIWEGNKMFQRIDTVFLPVSDLSAATRWYIDKCGFQLRWHDEINEYAAMEVGDGETVFTLVQKKHMNEQMPVDHEWFTLYADDIHVAYQAFKDANVETTDITSGGNMEFFHFKDLDGNVIGVCSFEEDAA